MLIKVFSIVLLLPFLEIIFFILASNFLSLTNIITIILVSGIIGFYIFSRAKIGALKSIKLILEPQPNSEGQMIKCLLYCISGLLLIIPGLISDSIGLSVMLCAILGFKEKGPNIKQPDKKGATIEGEYDSEER